MPEVKREKVSTESVRKFKVTGSGGKQHEVQEEAFTEKEIEAVNLVKLAPLFYFCPDNNKIYNIPFSIQFTILEFSQLAAKMSFNLQELLKKINQAKRKGK